MPVLTTNRMVKFLALFCSAVFLFAVSVFPNPVIAVPTQQINYQGKLTNASGVAVADGTYQMEFKLYNALSGGTAVWTETWSGANEVTVTNGLFSIMLGSTTPLSTVDFSKTLYLSINIEGDGEMTPRKTFGSVPLAMRLDGTASTTNMDISGYLNLEADKYLKYNQTNLAFGSSTAKNFFFAGAGNLGLLDVSGGLYSGTYNYGLGESALSVVSTGYFNNAFGSAVLWQNTTGNQNSAFGNDSMYSNIGGTFNSAFGASSLYLNQSGQQNSSFGGASLYSNVSGSSNSSFGYDSLYSNTASNNSAFGAFSLWKNAGGSNNTAIGYLSLSQNTLGVGNVALGYQAGDGTGNYSSYIDDYSTFIGYGASRDNAVATTTKLTNATAIGYNARVGISNAIVLGSTSTPVSVGIGTSTPGGTFGEKLTVVGNTYTVGDATTTGESYLGNASSSVKFRDFSITTGTYSGSKVRLLQGNAYYTIAGNSSQDNFGLFASGGLSIFEGNADPTPFSGLGLTYPSLNNPRIVLGDKDLSNAATITYATTSKQLNFAVAEVYDFGDQVSIGSGGPNGTSLLTVRGDGAVLGGFCVDNDSSCTSAAGNVAAASYTTGSTDLAENYPLIDNSLESGDVVSVAFLDRGTTTENFGLIKAQKDSPVIGIISTKPGITLGLDYDLDNTNKKPVALSGRVPVKVNMEGGEIKIGDYLTLSSEPGVATKATSSGMTVAIALESANQPGKVLAFVNLNHAHLSSSISQGNIEYETLSVKSISGIGNNWSISESGNLIVKNIKAENAIIESGVTVKDRATGLYNCIYVENGVLKNKEGECQSSSEASSSSGGSTSGGGSSSSPETSSSTPSSDTSSTTSVVEETVPVDPTPEPETSPAETPLAPAPESTPDPEPAPDTPTADPAP